MLCLLTHFTSNTRLRPTLQPRHTLLPRRAFLLASRYSHLPYLISAGAKQAWNLLQTALKDREMLNDGQAMAANLACKQRMGWYVDCTVLMLALCTAHVAQRSSGTPPTTMRGTAAQNGLPSPPPLAAGPHPQQVQRKAMVQTL